MEDPGENPDGEQNGHCNGDEKIGDQKQGGHILAFAWVTTEKEISLFQCSLLFSKYRAVRDRLVGALEKKIICGQVQQV
ncbi:hypothetical protein GCM10023091_06310 [Ravibacter arvi]|uniref:Uncharacterized protein n=1 Tax=Ravibacter arvi TaxID=2051041 RepID=A0ABP8LNN3_9BACT